MLTSDERDQCGQRARHQCQSRQPHRQAGTGLPHQPQRLAAVAEGLEELAWQVAQRQGGLLRADWGAGRFIFAVREWLTLTSLAWQIRGEIANLAALFPGLPPTCRDRSATSPSPPTSTMARPCWWTVSPSESGIALRAHEKVGERIMDSNVDRERARHHHPRQELRHRLRRSAHQAIRN